MATTKRAGRPPKDSVLIQLRIAVKLFDRVERWRSERYKETGSIPTRTAAIETLVEEGLRK